jgi:maleate isomerase
MNVATPIKTERAAPLGTNTVRVGLIIPSVNTYSEPQFTHYAPEGMGIHVARARVAGPFKRPLPDMAGEIAEAAKLLSDMHPDVIVFHCTDTSMTQGPNGEGRILDIVREATGIPALATSKLVREGLEALGIKRMILLTPYKSNKAVIDYVEACGFNVVRDKAMNLEAKDFGSVTPAQWAWMAKELDGPDVDGVFLSCTNTTQIEAIADIERQLGKPVVNSNQAVLWGCMKRLKDKLPPHRPMPGLGRLMEKLG